jgi:phosphoglycerate dehydrogenase-like enzyme
VKAVLHYRTSPGFALKVAALDLDTVIVDELDQPGFAREMADAEVLLHVLEAVGAAAIAAAPRLRLIQKIGVGVNTIDLNAARRHGVAVCNMPGTNTQAVAEMTLLLMLATLRHLAQLDRMTRAGAGWTLSMATIDAQSEICGRTVGLVGFGAVARRLVPILQALGATVVYASRRQAADTRLRFLSLPELLAEADIVSLHLPLDASTKHIMNAAAFAAMKPGSILVNTARGGLVDPAALRQALDSGHLRGAGLDVFDREPAPAGDPLFRLPNVVVTPHLAWLTAETLDRSLAVIAENCRRLAAGDPLLHRVV